jgi:hypothetical protein
VWEIEHTPVEGRSYLRGRIDQERTPNALAGIEGKRLTGLKFCTWSKAVIGDRNRGEFEQETSPVQEWLKQQKASLEREIGRQLAVARDANEIIRSTSHAAGDATAEIRHVRVPPGRR